MIEDLLGPPAAAAEAFGDDPAAALFPAEQAVIGPAPERRRREFATARGCARAALARLGHPAVPVLPGPGGAPQWPPGIAGSITHCAGYRAAAVAPAALVRSLGLDAEPNRPLRRPAMLAIIARPAERARLARLAARHPGVCWDKLLFSAKEAVYKAWYPLARCWLDFGSADIVIDAGRGTFTARLLVPAPPGAGALPARLHGRWLARQGLVLAAVMIPAAPGPRSAARAPVPGVAAAPGTGPRWGGVSAR